MIYIFFFKSNEKSRKARVQEQKSLSKKLLAKAIEDEFALSADFSQIRKNEHGKPYFLHLPIQYNISHCEGAVCCAVGKREIGIDIERADRESRLIWDKVCDETERQDIENAGNKDKRFMQYWTLKESYVKYLGKGLSYGLKKAGFVWYGDIPQLKDSHLPFQQEQLEEKGQLYLLSACGEEMPMPIKIIRDL
ncbi:4'-phosphopantetheinyl transferase family protein [Scatolibacter rhodanostii]|uniref:4'-phosphopantetheinyl transferase family protein n=1 Tax=Scatolibacter rhodanostii TaxID=2014781 RepID=UPI00135671C8|nr:4'-phosphopantetheinyl transferase superfamily protein [Scatolibacter rhodanostii]